MSPKTPTLAAGLAVLSVLWPVSPCEARQDAPSAPAAAPADSPSSSEASVILLSDGSLLRGKVIEGESGPLVVQKLGTIPLKKRRVEGIFGSTREVYEYKRNQLAQDDPDEHLNLAHWCLKEGLKAEAKEELSRVLTLVGGHPQASAMLASIEAESLRPAPIDPGLRRTSVEMPVDGAPGDLDPDVLGLPSGLPRKLGKPVIFDLPPALASRLFQEFAGNVHLELQRRCAGCHNERSESTFQLKQVRTRPELKDPLLLRGNLDATLRLIDRERPERSELLTSSLMPHGKLNTPVLSGPNHPSYRILAHWVQGLKSRDAANGPESSEAPSDFPLRETATPAESRTFGADRGPKTHPAAAPAPFAASKWPDPAVQSQAPVGSPPQIQATTLNASKDHPSLPPDTQFPDPSTLPTAAPLNPSAAAAGVPGATSEELKPLTAADLDRMATKKKNASKIKPSDLQKFMTRGQPVP